MKKNVKYLLIKIIKEEIFNFIMKEKFYSDFLVMSYMISYLCFVQCIDESEYLIYTYIILNKT